MARFDDIRSDDISAKASDFTVEEQVLSERAKSFARGGSEAARAVDLVSGLADSLSSDDDPEAFERAAERTLRSSARRSIGELVFGKEQAAAPEAEANIGEESTSSADMTRMDARRGGQAADTAAAGEDATGVEESPQLQDGDKGKRPWTRRTGAGDGDARRAGNEARKRRMIEAAAENDRAVDPLLKQTAKVDEQQMRLHRGEEAPGAFRTEAPIDASGAGRADIAAGRQSAVSVKRGLQSNYAEPRSMSALSAADARAGALAAGKGAASSQKLKVKGMRTLADGDPLAARQKKISLKAARKNLAASGGATATSAAAQAASKKAAATAAGGLAKALSAALAPFAAIIAGIAAVIAIAMFIGALVTAVIGGLWEEENKLKSFGLTGDARTLALFLRDEMGMEDVQIAGIIGNSICETYNGRWREGNELQISFACEEAPWGDGSGYVATGIGFMQFSGDEATRLRAYAAARNKDWSDPDIQLAFFRDISYNEQWIRQTTSIWTLGVYDEACGRSDFEAATDPEVAARIFMGGYLRPSYSPGVNHYENRQAAAAAVLRALRVGGISASGLAQMAIDAAWSMVGGTYIRTEYDPANRIVDCNGLTYYAWHDVCGIDIPYPSGTYGYGQYDYLSACPGWKTRVEDLAPGDVVFFSCGKGSWNHHVGLYIGDGMTIQAISETQGIQCVSIYFCGGFQGGACPDPSTW